MSAVACTALGSVVQISQYWRGKHRIKSKMEIDPATQGDAGIYECHANNK